MTPHNSSGRYATLKRYALLLGIMWTALVAVSFGWNFVGVRHSVEDHARIRARVAFDKDVFYRRWNAQHRGVYARSDGKTVPNPYLEVPERDISTPSGIPLTLINPAYMTRMVHEIQATGNGVRGHITSLNPIRPENEADSWETAALRALEKGGKEVSSIEYIDAKPFMRLMRPLVTENACLQCHAKQGYKVGDIRGGISVSVPMERLWAASRDAILALALSHAAIWILGMLVLYAGARKMGIGLVEEERKEKALLESEERYRQMFHESRAVMLIIDPETSFILNANQAAGDFYGYSLDELRQMKISDINVLPPEKIFQEMAKAKARRLNYFLFQHRLKSGEIRDVEVHSTPLRIQDKMVLYSIIHDITDRKRAERERIEAEERYRSLFSSITDPIMVFDAETLKIQDVNDAALHLYGYSRDEFLNLKSLDISAEPEASLVSYGETLEGKRWAVPLRYHKKKDGTVFPVEISASTFAMTGKAVLCGVIRDITERRQAEEILKNAYADLEIHVKERTAELTRVNEELLQEIGERKRAEETLRLSEERYRRLFENAPLMYVITWNEQGAPIIRECNQFFLRSLGYTHEEVEGKPLADLYSSESRAELLDRGGYASALAGKFFIGERELVRRDGGLIPTLLYTATELDSNGRVIGTRAMFVDITERKKAEEAIRKTEEMLELALQGADIGLWDWNLKTGTAVWNERATRMIGYLLEELQPDVRTWKRLVHPEDWSQVSEVLNDHLKGRLPFFEVEYRLRCKSGEWKWILGRGKVVEYDEHGKPSRMTGTSLDITERKCAELERADLRAQLIQAQKMEAIGTLAGGIAHDFNNLLTVILGYSELIISEKVEGDTDYEDLKRIIHSARTAGDMVQQILAFSRKTDTKPRPINLNKQVEQLKKMLSRLIPKTVEVEIILDLTIPIVNADPAQIEQVLLNLAVNARDAMPNGGSLLIETQAVLLDDKYCSSHIEASQGPHALLVVSDTGAGIDKTTIHRIFEPFYTTKEPGQGTGLGLAMVYGIVKSHGGHITCESELGSGSTFRIYLPAHHLEGEADVTVSGEFAALGEGTILLVDDEDFVRDLGRRILEKVGYNVITAINGQEAVEIFKEKRDQISLVILDLIMPVMDGNQCLEKILKLDPKAKVLIASGYSPDGTTRKTEQEGAKGFVGKPFDLKQLLRTIRDALTEHS